METSVRQRVSPGGTAPNFIVFWNVINSIRRSFALPKSERVADQAWRCRSLATARLRQVLSGSSSRLPALPRLVAFAGGQQPPVLRQPSLKPDSGLSSCDACRHTSTEPVRVAECLNLGSRGSGRVRGFFARAGL